MSDDKKESLRDKLNAKKEELSNKTREAVENGAGNEVIEASQGMLEAVLTAPLAACKILTRQMLLLTPKMVSKITGRIYLLAGGLCAINLLIFVFNSDFRFIIHIAAIILAAFILDLLIRKQEISDKALSPKASKRVQSSEDESDMI